MTHSPSLRALASVCLVGLAGGCEPPPESLSEPASSVVTLMWSGTLRGEVEPCDCPLVPGGLARLATLIDTQRDSAEGELLLVEMGDVAGPPSDDDEGIDPELARRVRADLAYEGLDRIGYDLYVPGELDLTLGVDALVERIDAAGAALLTTSVWRGAEPLGEGVHWIETDQGEVALLSVVAPLGERELQAARRGHDQPIATLEPLATLAMTLESVGQRADFVVLLAHGPTDWARTVLSEVDGIDLCVVAHEDEDPRGFEQVGESLLLRTAIDGKSLGRMDIELFDDGSVAFSGAPWPPSGDYEEDPDLRALVKTLPQRLDEAQRALDQANPADPHPSGAEYLGFSACGECHADVVEVWLRSDHVSAFQALQRTGWQVEPQCWECHTTGFGYATGFESRATTPLLSSVGCEACHGPSSRHVEDEVEHGEVDEQTCRRCHTAERDPDFDYDSQLELIRHEGEIIP